MSRFVRTFSTARVLRDAPSPSSLGFTISTEGRQRSLPSLAIPSSSRRSVNAKEGAAAAPQGKRGRSGPKAQSTSQSTSAQSTSQSTSAQSGSRQAGAQGQWTERNKPPKERRPRAGGAELAEFFEGAELAAPRKEARGKGDKARRQPRGRDAAAGRDGRGDARGQKKNDKKTAGRKDKDDESTTPAVAPRLPIARGAAPNSPFALFGSSSLLKPARRGAMAPETSFWAKGKDASAARKTDVLRLAGEYAALTPPRPKDSVLDRIAWTAGMNPTVSMRQAAHLREVIKTYTS